jgi:catechol 2,3-dioxygenase-like lactoylglutathione lyase family enzyme
MEQIIAKLIQDFEEGKTSRRQLIQTLAMATGAVSLAGVAPAVAAEASPVTTVGIDHISYQVADYAKTRDFYVGLFGLKILSDTGKQCMLQIGGIKLVARNGTGATPTIDHIGYAVENWNRDAALAEIRRRGFDAKTEGAGDVQLRDPDGYHVQLTGRA